jgi:glycosyltransferase involved in cell wall biosynthesis
MRIAMVTETYPPEVNGVARTLATLVEGLRRRGHSLQLVRPRQNGHDTAAARPGFEELLRPGIPIPRYPSLQMGAPSGRALRGQWTQERPDLVHVATEGPLGWSALAAARALGIPVASDFRTNFHAYSRHYGAGWLERPARAYLRAFHNRAGCTMVPTPELAGRLSAAGFERVRVVGRGVDAALFNPARRSRELRAGWGATDATLVVLCVSRFAPEKNLPLAIEACEAIRRRRPDCRLVLVGDGPLQKGLESRNAARVVAGRLADEDLARHYASADLFLFPSTTETFGNVTLEAMASGLPIVAYDYAAARAFLRHGESGLLARFDDRADFVRLAETLAADRALSRDLGAAARRIAGSITWERVLDDFEAVLADVAA